MIAKHSDSLQLEEKTTKELKLTNDVTPKQNKLKLGITKLRKGRGNANASKEMNMAATKQECLMKMRKVDCSGNIARMSCNYLGIVSTDVTNTAEWQYAAKRK